MPFARMQLPQSLGARKCGFPQFELLIQFIVDSWTVKQIAS